MVMLKGALAVLQDLPALLRRAFSGLRKEEVEALWWTPAPPPPAAAASSGVWAQFTTLLTRLFRIRLLPPRFFFLN